MVSRTLLIAFKDVFSELLSQDSSSPTWLIIIVPGFIEDAEKNYKHLSHLNIDIKYIY